MPCVAGELHQQNIEKVVNRAIESAGVPPSVSMYTHNVCSNEISTYSALLLFDFIVII